MPPVKTSWGRSNSWGDASQIDAMLAGLKFAMSAVDVEWITFLSGQDYPLRPLAAIETDLRSADCDAFVRAAPADTYAFRYEMQYWQLPRFRRSYLFPGWVRSLLLALRRRINATQRLLRIEVSPRGLPSRLGIRLPGAPFGKDFVPFKGSQWMTLSQHAARRLLKFTEENPQVFRYYRRTLIPDESYFQSVIWNDKGLRVRDDHRRFILWDEYRLAHPITLTMQHFDSLIASGKDFGRKFDMAVDERVLDALDRVVSG